MDGVVTPLIGLQESFETTLPTSRNNQQRTSSATSGIQRVLIVFAVSDHDDVAGPEEQRAEAGAEESVPEEPTGAATQPRQPPHAPPWPLTSQVSHSVAMFQLLWAFISQDVQRGYKRKLNVSSISHFEGYNSMSRRAGAGALCRLTG